MISSRIGLHSPAVTARPRVPPLRSLLRLTAALLTLGPLAACDAVREPERFYNSEAQPPTVGALDLAALQPGQHVAGSVPLFLTLDSLAGRIERVVVTVGEEEAAVLTRAPFAFTLQTAQYPQGAQDVSVSVYLRQPNGGLLNALGAPAVFLTVPLVFDQSPPTPVALTSVTVEDGRARLRWTANTDPNFYAYLIVRRAVWTTNAAGTAWQPVIDTLFDRSATTYLDAPFPDVIGARAEYDVLVWNRQEVSASQGAIEAVLGDRRPALYSTLRASPVDASRGVVYASTTSGLAAFSLDGHRELRRIDYGTLSAIGSYQIPGAVRLGPGATEIAFTLGENGSFRPRLFVLDAATLQVRRSFLLPEYAGTFEWSPPSIVTVAEGRLSLVDAQDGSVRSRSEPLFSGPAQTVGMAPDGGAVYVVDEGRGDRTTLHRVALSTLQPVASYSWSSPTAREVAPQVAADGRVYVYTHPTATVLDGPTLAPLATIDLTAPPPWGSARDVATAFEVAEGTLFVGYDGGVSFGAGSNWEPTRGTVVAIDLASGQRTRSWSFTSRIARVRPAGARWLYVDSDSNGPHTWALPL